MPCLHFSFEGETRRIKCNADERCRRQLDGGEPLSAPFGADANESRHSDQGAKLLGQLAIILSNVMCAVVAFNYRDMLCGIQHSCCSAPAWVAFLSAIPYAVAIAVCIILAVVFKKRSTNN